MQRPCGRTWCVQGTEQEPCVSNAAKEPQRSEVQTAACARAGQHLMMLFSSLLCLIVSVCFVPAPQVTTPRGQSLGFT